MDKPAEKIDETDRFQLIVELKDKSLATSGNYRKFWVDKATGVKYAHTIDPITGVPARNRLLSVSIIADKCIDADGYATACMVMGPEKAMQFIEGKKGMEAYFVSSDDEGNWVVTQTEGFKKYVLKKALKDEMTIRNVFRAVSFRRKQPRPARIFRHRSCIARWAWRHKSYKVHHLY